MSHYVSVVNVVDGLLTLLLRENFMSFSLLALENKCMFILVDVIYCVMSKKITVYFNPCEILIKKKKRKTNQIKNK